MQIWGKIFHEYEDMNDMLSGSMMEELGVANPSGTPSGTPSTYLLKLSMLKLDAYPGRRLHGSNEDYGRIRNPAGGRFLCSIIFETEVSHNFVGFG